MLSIISFPLEKCEWKKVLNFFQSNNITLLFLDRSGEKLSQKMKLTPITWQQNFGKLFKKPSKYVCPIFEYESFKRFLHSWYQGISFRYLKLIQQLSVPFQYFLFSFKKSLLKVMWFRASIDNYLLQFGPLQKRKKRWQQRPRSRSLVPPWLLQQIVIPRIKILL